MKRFLLIILLFLFYYGYCIEPEDLPQELVTTESINILRKILIDLRDRIITSGGVTISGGGKLTLQPSETGVTGDISLVNDIANLRTDLESLKNLKLEDKYNTLETKINNNYEILNNTINDKYNNLNNIFNNKLDIFNLKINSNYNELRDKIKTIDRDVIKLKQATWNLYDLINVSDNVASELCVSTGLYSMSMGFGSGSGGDYSFSSGFYCTALGNYSSAMGNSCDAWGIGSNAFGYDNIASGDYSNAFGIQNEATGNYSNAFGGKNIVTGDYCIASGNTNEVNCEGSNAFGSSNTITSNYSTALGLLNVIRSTYSLACGYNNWNNGESSLVIGSNNSSSGTYSGAIGINNNITGNYSYAFGKNNIVSGEHNIVIGENNITSNDGSTISGGRNSTASGVYSTVGGGYLNTASGTDSIVSGGQENTASGVYSTVSGGYGNIASDAYSTISGGRYNTISSPYSTIGGGDQNTISIAGDEGCSTISGGYRNTISSPYSTIGGGNNNTISGEYDWAGGSYANITGSHTFAWVNSDSMITIPTSNAFIIHGSSVGIGTVSPGAKLEVIGDLYLGAANRMLYTNNNIINACYNYNVDNVALVLNYSGYQNGNTRFRDLFVYNGKYSPVFVVDGSSGCVGIGTIDPNTNLDVNGRGRFTGVGPDPTSGQGMEVFVVTGNGIILSYDRGTSTYKPLLIDGNKVCINSVSNGNVGIGTTNPINGVLEVVGQVYFSANCSALSFTDRSKVPKSLQEAYDSLFSVRYSTITKAIDYSKLHSFIRRENKTKIKDKKGKVKEKIEYSRDIGANVSVNSIVLQDLVDKNAKLENRIKALEDKLKDEK